MKQQFYIFLRIVETLATSFKNEDVKEIERLIADDQDLKREFFTRIATIEWFEYLYKKDYFKPEQMFGNFEGMAFSYLYYLDRISTQIEQRPQYAKLLLDIIESIVRFSKNEKKIKNQYIWNSCIEIIANIPAQIIKDNFQFEDSFANEQTKYGFSSFLDELSSLPSKMDLAVIEIGKKLLPKFLNEESTIEYAEKIIDLLTRCRLVEKDSSSIYGKAEIYLQHDPYWVLDAFKNNAEIIGQKCSESVVYKIADRLKAVLNYKHKDSSNNFKIDQDVYRIIVSRKETGKYDNNIPLYDDGKFILTINQFTPEQTKDLNIDADTFTLKDISPGKVILEDIQVSATSKEEFISELKRMLPKNINWSQAENFEGRVNGLYIALFQDYSQIWLKSLIEDPIGSTAKEALIVILRNILINKLKSSHEETCKILKDFLGEKYQFSIFRRSSLHFINKSWNSKSIELLNDLLNFHPDILEEFIIESDFFEILRSHNNEFPTDLLNKISDIISYVPDYYKRDDKQLAYRKYRLLSALKDKTEYKKLYEEARLEAGITKDIPYDPKKFKSGVFQVVDKSPITKEEILEKAIPELIKYINDFKESGTFEEPISRQGLVRVLQSAVEEDPKHFSDSIDELHKIHFLYVNSLFEGLINAWVSNKNIDWKKTLQFTFEYISTEAFSKFINDENESNPFAGRHSWILDNIVRLIKVGCTDDNRAFDPSLFPIVDKIFEIIYRYIKEDKKPNIQLNSLTYAMNTTLGKTIEAFIYFSLRKSRIKQPEPNWGLKEYTRFTGIGIEAYIWLGYYLSNIRYLDKDCTGNLLNELLKSSDNKNWKFFMEGYLYRPNVYRDMFILLKEHYKKAISIEFSNEIDRSLVTHIVLAYLYFDESLEVNNTDGRYSLFRMLLNSPVNKLNRWSEIARFLWSKVKSSKDKETNKDDDGNVNKKIINFWRWTYDNQDTVKSLLIDDYTVFLKSMLKLTTVLDSIDDEKEKWLTSIVTVIDDIHGTDTSFFIEYLAEFDDKDSIERIGRIYLELLKKITPIYKQENIAIIVRQLYCNDCKYCKDYADNICNTYGRRGHHFLRPLWEENNK